MNEVTAHARRSDVETSHEAAAAVDVVSDARVTLELIGYHSQTGGFTLKDVERMRVRLAPWMKASSVRSRCAELRRNGYLEWAVDENGEQLYDDLTPRSRKMRMTTLGRYCFGAGEEPILTITRPPSARMAERAKVLAAVQQAGDERELSATTAAIIRRALEILG